MRQPLPEVMHKDLGTQQLVHSVSLYRGESGFITCQYRTFADFIRTTGVKNLYLH